MATNHQSFLNLKEDNENTFLNKFYWNFEIIRKEKERLCKLLKFCTLGSEGMPSATSDIPEISNQHMETDPETVDSSRSETDSRTIDSHLSESGPQTVELNESVKEQKEFGGSNDENRADESTTRSSLSSSSPENEAFSSDSNGREEDRTASSISSRRRGEPAPAIEELPLSLQRIQLRHWLSTNCWRSSEMSSSFFRFSLVFLCLFVILRKTYLILKTSILFGKELRLEIFEFLRS